MEGKLILKEGKMYISKNEELRVGMIWLYYDILVAEHKERWKTTELVTRNYQWPGITKDIGKYVDKCNMCQKIKNQIETLIEKLMTNEVPERLQTYLIVDIIIMLLLVVEKDMILVVYDRLSKIAHFIAITEGALVEWLAQLFRDNMQKSHRLLKSVISDKRLQFTAKLTKELNKMLGIRPKLLTFFHLQMDRIEQMNQKFEQYLQFFVDHKQKDQLE